jgi:hypothetical protein
MGMALATVDYADDGDRLQARWNSVKNRNKSEIRKNDEARMPKISLRISFRTFFIPTSEVETMDDKDDAD